eukprot:5416320-Alexandrium_andersonii.AAC.1
MCIRDSPSPVAPGWGPGCGPATSDPRSPPGRRPQGAVGRVGGGGPRGRRRARKQLGERPNYAAGR